MTLFDADDTETPQGNSRLGEIPFFSEFCMGPAVSGRGLCDIHSVIQSYKITCQKIWKSWRDGNIPITLGFYYNRFIFDLYLDFQIT